MSGTLIFQHLPKCGGMSARRILKGIPGYGRTFTINGEIDKRITHFKQLPEEERYSFDCVVGHMGFGLHRYVAEPVTYFILFRDPVQRVVSEYFYIKQRLSRHYFREYVETHTLLEFVESGIGTHVDNQCTRMVARADGLSCISRNNKQDFPDGVPAGECSAIMLAQAIDHCIQPNVVVGLLDDFETSMQCLLRTLGVKKEVTIPRINATKRPREFVLEHGVAEVIRERNTLDIQLYAAVQTLFAEQKVRWL